MDPRTPDRSESRTRLHTYNKLGDQTDIDVAVGNQILIESTEKRYEDNSDEEDEQEEEKEVSNLIVATNDSGKSEVCSLSCF